MNEGNLLPAMTMVPPQELKAVVFDIDGVIIDSRQQMGTVLRNTLQHHGLKTSETIEDLFFSCMGMPLPEIFEKLRLPPELTETYRRISRSSLNLAVVFPGMMEILLYLKERGTCLGAITGKDRTRTLEVMNYFSLTPYFSAMVCGDDPFPGKPQPNGLTWMLEQMAVAPEHAAMVGDSPLDIACAKSARVFAIGAGWGFSTIPELGAGGAGVCSTVAELQLWLKGSARGRGQGGG